MAQTGQFICDWLLTWIETCESLESLIHRLKSFVFPAFIKYLAILLFWEQPTGCEVLLHDVHIAMLFLERLQIQVWFYILTTQKLKFLLNILLSLLMAMRFQQAIFLLIHSFLDYAFPVDWSEIRELQLLRFLQDLSTSIGIDYNGNVVWAWIQCIVPNASCLQWK